MQGKLNNKGFSLIELMVVVAIIGILAAVGIPQYAKFQAKARSGEAKAALSAFFVTEKSFLTEFSLYTVDVKNLGFAVEGTNLRYATGFGTGTACGGYTIANGAPAETNTRSNSPAIGGATWFAATGIVSGTVAPVGVIAAGALATLTNSNCTATTFRGVAAGDPRNTPAAVALATADTWTINEAKLLTNVQILN